MTELEIKILLTKHIVNSLHNFTIGAEVPFQFGERRADLVLLNSGFLSAFEIKGARDRLSRLEYQVESYKKFFDYCYIVCEPSNLSEVRKNIPKDFGIFIAETTGVKKIRKSKQFKKQDKLMLSSILSVEKLKKITKKRELRSKHELCAQLAKEKKLNEIRHISRKDFEERYSVASRLMRQETTNTINADDIYTITKTPPSPLTRKVIS
ncbi:sce7726 family protein [Halomonas elongata]|uniref:sce7726 family protein n=1 Tax=Halomonas elongata TaxID=2746 RepID=UPI00186B7F88|nr:sce7726 family protein [Halomonas elongata]MBW5801342.1 sce7726 family protein [Halomonas elongata]